MGTAIIAFDPGVTGACAILNAVGVEVFDLPVRMFGKGKGFVTREIDPSALSVMLSARFVAYRRDRFIAVVERTAARPTQGVASMFSMGYSRGVIHGVLAGNDVPTYDVEPAKWKAAFQLLGADKKESIRVARALYPALAENGSLSLAKHHNRAEAVLMAHYGMIFS